MSLADRERFNAKFRAGAHCSSVPSPLLITLGEQLPKSGCALDVAGGAGRNALWLAERGLSLTLCDISDVALSLAQQRAQTSGLAINTVQCDLESDPFPPGPWDLIVSVDYLQLSLFPLFCQQLAPGGRLLFIQATEQNLERHQRPSRRFLVECGAIPQLLKPLEVLTYSEAWRENNRHEAHLLARKPEAHDR